MHGFYSLFFILSFLSYSLALSYFYFFISLLYSWRNRGWGVANMVESKLECTLGMEAEHVTYFNINERSILGVAVEKSAKIKPK